MNEIDLILTANVWLFFRIICGLCGIAVALHFHCMANFLRKSSLFVKLTLTATTANGVLLAVSALQASLLGCLVFGVAALACVLTVQLEAWRAGVHISDYIDRAYKIKQKSDEELRSVQLMSLHDYMDQPYTTPAELKEDQDSKKPD
jgi:hypothetical protein